jgi:hypothetical protein
MYHLIKQSYHHIVVLIFVNLFIALRPSSRQRESISCSVISKQDGHIMKEKKIKEENEMDIEDGDGEDDVNAEEGNKEKEKEKERQENKGTKEKEKEKERPVQGPNNGTGRYFVPQAGESSSSFCHMAPPLPFLALLTHNPTPPTPFLSPHDPTPSSHFFS